MRGPMRPHCRAAGSAGGVPGDGRASLSSGAGAVSTFTWTPNMHPLGHSARVVPLEAASPVDGIYNSDLAFWGRRAFQGTYEGFRIVDVADPENPIEINNYDECSPGTTQGNQGDVVVWDDILVRSWNSPRPARPRRATASSSGQASRASRLRHLEPRRPGPGRLRAARERAGPFPGSRSKVDPQRVPTAPPERSWAPRQRSTDSRVTSSP